MSYARLNTINKSGLHPNLRGYAPLDTVSKAGLSPNFRGMGSMGDVPTTQFAIGPGGQFSISTVTTPTSTSLSDQILTWMSQSTIVAGMPNSVFAIGGGVLALAWIFRGGRRR